MTIRIWSAPEWNIGEVPLDGSAVPIFSTEKSRKQVVAVEVVHAQNQGSFPTSFARSDETPDRSQLLGRPEHGFSLYSRRRGGGARLGIYVLDAPKPGSNRIPFDSGRRIGHALAACNNLPFCTGVNSPSRSTSYRKTVSSGRLRSMLTFVVTERSGIAWLSAYIRTVMFTQVAKAASSKSCGLKPECCPPLSAVVSEIP